MPFGEELGVGVGGRTVNLKYSITGADNVRQRFTGYEKDAETELDFAEARMYQNKHGRFTAPDPLLSSASIGNPQTFNRYVYVGNNPVNITDPLGLKWCRNPHTTTARWQGSCSGEYSDDVTGETWSVGNGSFLTDSGYRATRGDIIRLNSDGTTTLVRASPENTVATVDIQGGSNPASTVTGEVGVPASEI